MMNGWPSEPFDPSHPEILAAYVDGEFEGCPSLARFKRAVEDWLEHHPQALADLSAERRLKQLWQESTPPEPNDQVWKEVLADIKTDLQETKPATRRFPWGWLGGAAAAVLLLVLLGLSRLVFVTPGTGTTTQGPKNTVPPNGVEIFEVAEGHEVEILHIAGDDAPTLTVGTLPVEGELQVAQPGDIEITNMENSASQATPTMGSGPDSLLVWTEPAGSRP